MNFGQLLTAMVTPFTPSGKIDFDQTTALVKYLIDQGTDGLVVAGTTGESPILTSDEKLSLFRHVVKIADSKIPVIAGTGSNNTRATIEFTKKAESTGVDAVMVVAPYYNKPNQKGLYEHFKAVAEATSLPVMVYNIPGRSVINMTAETIIELSKINNIVSVKEASGNLDQMSIIIENTDSNFSLYSGDDGLTLPVLAIGGNGVISVASHIIGSEMKEMIQLYQEGNVEKAGVLHRQLLPVMRELFKAPSPAPVKAALRHKGIDTGSVQLPLVPLTAEEDHSLVQCINSIRLNTKN
ncbi:4-hydroxy-tetrahydrodipicolinate synthase [Bacillus taeanensis]|uniref:4-hydroxy-tetrahydrodipicolinate synthase n=1 Tax=Bacillus taeanensis TaxID=273032 RepID=A0A366XWH4_9BACI|nr:4-hydroxy-tetrahydrodipicolinate synthase [Bacillus taeanensis]RBW69898.1 4-hydroxy-tetrahydrodipicolinate synthase [Bacillus taeanensis]